jgi:hypothetical protein
MMHVASRRAWLWILLIAGSLAVPACLSTEDYDHEQEDANRSIVNQIREGNDLEFALSKLSDCNCSVSVEPKLVRVRVYPGPKGLPDAAVLARMSERIQEMTGTPPAQQIILSSQGQVLFYNGSAPK